MKGPIKPVFYKSRLLGRSFSKLISLIKAGKLEINLRRFQSKCLNFESNMNQSLSKTGAFVFV